MCGKYGYHAACPYTNANEYLRARHPLAHEMKSHNRCATRGRTMSSGTVTKAFAQMGVGEYLEKALGGMNTPAPRRRLLPNPTLLVRGVSSHFYTLGNATALKVLAI